MSDRGYVLPPGGGRTLDTGPFRMHLKADGAATAQHLTLLEAEEPPNFGPPLHIHDNAAEAFYVLEGLYIVFMAGQEYSCPAGSFVYVPAGVEHGFRVGSRSSRKLNIYTPAAMEATSKRCMKPPLGVVVFPTKNSKCWLPLTACA